MTIPVTEPFISGPYAGNGVTVQFDYGFRIYAETELKVVRKNADDTLTVLALTADYTVAGVNQDTGRQITLVAGNRLPTGATLTIEPDITLSQDRPFSDQTSTNLGELENIADKTTSMVRQLKGLFDRTPIAQPGNQPGEILIGDDNEVLIWDANSNIVPGPNSDEIANAQTYAEAALVSKNSAAISEANAENFAIAAENSAQSVDVNNLVHKDQNLSDLQSIPTTLQNLGLQNVDNTSDVDKPISSLQQNALDDKLNLSGGTLSGALTLSGDPINNLHSSTKQYVDNVAYRAPDAILTHEKNTTGSAGGSTANTPTAYDINTEIDVSNLVTYSGADFTVSADCYAQVKVVTFGSYMHSYAQLYCVTDSQYVGNSENSMTYDYGFSNLFFSSNLEANKTYKTMMTSSATYSHSKGYVYNMISGKPFTNLDIKLWRN